MSEQNQYPAAPAVIHKSNADFDAVHMVYLSPENCSFSESPGRMLDMVYDGKEYRSVLLYRSFPHSDSGKFISVRDKEEKEIGIIRDFSEFDPDTRRLLEWHLNVRYFAPIIRRIHSIRDEFGYVFWNVDTDCGTSRFVVRKDSKSVVNVGGGKVMVLDVDGNRFMIPDIAKLSDREMKLIEIYL